MTLILTGNIHTVFLFLYCENQRAYIQQGSTKFQHKQKQKKSGVPKLSYDVNYTRKVTSQKGS